MLFQTCYLVRLQHANEVNITDSKSDAGAWTDLVLQDVNNISSGWLLLYYPATEVVIGQNRVFGSFSVLNVLVHR